jgi:hypothetical protein
MRNIHTAVAMTTGKKLLSNTLGVAAVICALAVPGYSATATSTIDFSGGGGGTISASETVGNTVNAGTFTVPFNQLFIAGAGDANDDGTWLLTSTNLTMAAGTGTTFNFTLTGTIASCLSGACTGGGTNLGGGAFTSVVLETFTVSSMKDAASLGSTVSAYDASGTTFTMQFGAPTSLNDSATLLTALGESGGTTAPFTTNALGSINGSGTSAGSTFTGSATSSFDNTTVTYTVAATPEPVSFVLLGTGLLAIGLISRRRSAAART